MGHTTTLLLFLLADAVFLISLVLLVIAAFRIRPFYGFAVLFLPFSGLLFANHYGYHARAIKPDFNVADVVTGREAWNGDYVYMDTRPGVFYRSADCEFNPQTKYFYSNRDVPKKKLSDAENREIVRLYRIMGKDETIISTLQKRLADAGKTSADLIALNTQLADAAKR